MTAQELFDSLNDLRSSGVDLSDLIVGKEYPVRNNDGSRGFEVDRANFVIADEEEFLIK